MPGMSTSMVRGEPDCGPEVVPDVVGVVQGGLQY